MIIMKGVPASPGIAIGKAYVFEDNDLVIEKHSILPDNVKNEVKRFKDAVRITVRFKENWSDIRAGLKLLAKPSEAWFRPAGQSQRVQAGYC